jgi:hypothetical protein
MDDDEYVYEDESLHDDDVDEGDQGESEQQTSSLGGGDSGQTAGPKVGIFACNASDATFTQLANGLRSLSDSDVLPKIKAAGLRVAERLALDEERAMLFLTRASFKNDKLDDYYLADAEKYKMEHGLSDKPDAVATDPAAVVFDSVEMEDVPISECEVRSPPPSLVG